MGKLEKRTLERYFDEKIGMTLVLDNSKKVKLENISCCKDFILLFFNYEGRLLEVSINGLNNFQLVLGANYYRTVSKKVSSFSSFSHELKQLLLDYIEYIDNQECFYLEWE